MSDKELQAVWARVLRAVRDAKQFSLFGLLSTLNDVEFTDGKITLHTHNDAEKNLLKQHLPTLQTLSGHTVEIVVQDNTVVASDNNRDYIARLKDIFGDKVEIV